MTDRQRRRPQVPVAGYFPPPAPPNTIPTIRDYGPAVEPTQRHVHMTDRVRGTPGGSRDVWWCWIVGDPYIVGYPPNKDGIQAMTCALCGWADDPGDDARIPTEAFLRIHTFVCHVLKPDPRTPFDTSDIWPAVES